MTDINNYVTNNFNENINYIEKNHPELFSKLVSLDNAIANAHYTEKYELMYENDSFDVMEKATQKLLYDGKSNIHTKASLDNIDYSLEHDTFETFNEKNISDDDVVKYNNIEPFSHRLYGFAPIINLCQKESLQKENLKDIYKYIFFGVGLGLHIEPIHKKISSEVYLVIEDDLELFRLSLFTTNYRRISKKSTLIFSIFEDEDEFSKTATSFLEKKYYYNQYIKFFRLLSHSDKKIDHFQASILQQPHFGFHHSNLLLHYTKALTYLENYSFLNKSVRFDGDVFTKKPFLLLAAGPSLQKNKEWLKENQNRFTIIAVAATLPFLHKENIKPDIVTQLDAYEKTQQHFSDDIFDFIKDSIYIFSAKVPESITSKLNKEQLFFFENGTRYKELSIKPSAACAGSTTYQLLLLFGVKNIYLLGLDLALDNTSGKTHIDTHVNSRSLRSDKDTYEHKAYEVKGNFQDKVSTILLFRSSISAVDYSTQMLKQDGQTIYNLSDGAKFFDTVPKHTQDIVFDNSNDKEGLKENILSVCKNNSSNGLSDPELINIKNKLSHANKIKKSIETKRAKEYKNSQKFINDLFSLINLTLDDKLIVEYELTKIIDTYFRRVLPYIFDYFNTNDKYEKRNVNEINKLLTTHIIEIIDFYCDGLESQVGR